MDATALFIAIGAASGVFSYWLGRRLSARWAGRRRAQADADARAHESRQVRRARQRAEGKAPPARPNDAP